MREVPQSRFGLLWLALSTLVIVVILYAAYQSLFEEPVGVGLLLLAVPGGFFCWLTLKLWRKVRHNGPALIIQDSGLIFALISPTVMPWHALRDVYLGPIQIPQGHYRRGEHLKLRFEPNQLPVIQRKPEVQPIISNPNRDTSVFTLTQYEVGVDLREVRDLILQEWDRALKKRDAMVSVAKEVPLQLDETRGL